MSSKQRREELKAEWDAEYARRQKQYAKAIEEHAATDLIKAVEEQDLLSAPLRAAIVYLLERVRNDDIGVP